MVDLAGQYATRQADDSNSIRLAPPSPGGLVGCVLGLTSIPSPPGRRVWDLDQEPLHLLNKSRGVATVSPFFDMDSTVLRNLVTGAFRRSQFPCYQQLTTTISAHLQRILELPEPSIGKSRNELYKDVDHIMDDLVANISFVQSNQHCPGCRTS